MKEEEIIQYFYPNGEIPRDDCHFSSKSPEPSLTTTDSLAEGTHFRLDWSSPRDIAQKLVEVNVSDILASGGTPHTAFLNLGLSSRTQNPSWLESFSEQFLKSLAQYGTRLCGGDSFRAETTVLSLTLIGSLHQTISRPWLRSGGKLGDSIYITGPVGYSQLGFLALQSREEKLQTLPLEREGDFHFNSVSNTKKLESIGNSATKDFLSLAIEKHLRPKSRYDLVPILKNLPIHASMDITDGLVQDLERIAQASNLTLKIHTGLLPDWNELRNFLTEDEILTSGEELELILLGPEDLEKEVPNSGIKKIGSTEPVQSSPGVEYYCEGKPISISKKGFLHF